MRKIALMVASLWLGACATMVMGGIPPSAFEFHPTVPVGAGQPGGWKVAQVIILLGQASPSGPRAVWCDIEVASRVVLQQGLGASALICKRFQEEMMAIIGKSIPGVRVTKIQTPGFQPRRFPDGDELGLRGFPVGRSLSSVNR